MGGFGAGPDLPGLLAGPSAARRWAQKRAALGAASEHFPEHVRYGGVQEQFHDI